MKRQYFFVALLVISLSSALMAVYSIRKAFFAIEVAKHEINVHRNKMDSVLVRARSELDTVRYETSLLRLRAIVKHSLNSETSNFDKAVKIRHILYNQVPLKDARKTFNFMQFDSMFLRSTTNSEDGQICGGLAILYISALESQGIPARLVSIFSKNVEPNDNHVTVEFWNNGKWYASDPTFNIMYTSNGKYLSYAQLYETIKEKKPYGMVSNGLPVIPDKSIDNYYISMEDLLKYMVVHPGSVWKQGRKYEYAMEIYPGTWDGVLTAQNGDKKDARMFNTIYKYLYDGILL